MRVSHGHLQRLMPEPRLHSSKVDATSDQPRSTRMTQTVRNEVFIVSQPDVRLRLMPDRAVLILFDVRKRPKPGLINWRDGVSGTLRQRNGSAFPRFCDPEGRGAVVNIVPSQVNLSAYKVFGKKTLVLDN